MGFLGSGISTFSTAKVVEGAQKGMCSGGSSSPNACHADSVCESARRKLGHWQLTFCQTWISTPHEPCITTSLQVKTCYHSIACGLFGVITLEGPLLR